MPRKPAKPFYFTRQEPGQLIYKYRDRSKLTKRHPDGRLRTRRIPKDIVFMDAAEVWVLEHVYGVKPEPKKPLAAREAALVNLIQRTTNEGERAAAQQALNKLRGKHNEAA